MRSLENSKLALGSLGCALKRTASSNFGSKLQSTTENIMTSLFFEFHITILSRFHQANDIKKNYRVLPLKLEVTSFPRLLYALNLWSRYLAR